ncbi:MAG: hypothetical protein GQ532_06215 [Methylomarinum sp.]|nr:hypothetical protein [Methylomarinum sp.]
MKIQGLLSSNAYIKIIVLCFGVFFSSGVFSDECSIYQEGEAALYYQVFCLSGNWNARASWGPDTYCTHNGVYACTGGNYSPYPPPPETQSCKGQEIPVEDVCNTIEICFDGSTVEWPATCPIEPQIKQCPDGSSVPFDSECPLYECSDGSTAPIPELCPAPSYKECPNGQFVPIDLPCPTDSEQTLCPDGSYAVSPEFCPDLVPVLIDCPVYEHDNGIGECVCDVGYSRNNSGLCEQFIEPSPILITCPDGSTAPDLLSCPDDTTPKPTPINPDPIELPPYEPPSITEPPGGGGGGGGSGGGSDDPTRPISSPVPIDTPSPTPAPIITPIDDPCANGACDPDPEFPDLPKDYAREQTLASSVDVQQAIGQLISDIRFNELSAMVKFVTDSSNSLDVIEEYQAKNMDKFISIREELGLMHLDDNNFYDLLITRTDLTNDRMFDIYNQIDWASDRAHNDAVSDQAQNDQSNKINQQLLEVTKSKFQDDQLHQADLLLSNSNQERLLQQIFDNTDDFKSFSDSFSDNGALSPSFDSSGNLDVSTNSDLSGLDGIGSDLSGFKQGSLDKISDTTEFDALDDVIDSLIPGVSTLYTVIPSSSCSIPFQQTFTVMGKTRSFDMDVCTRLAELKLALAWVFAFYAGRTAFNNIFAPKGA